MNAGDEVRAATHGCPPWCVTDHVDARYDAHVGEGKTWNSRGDDGVRQFFEAFPVQATYAGNDVRQFVNVMYGGPVLTLPADQAPRLAALLEVLGHGEYAAMVREVAAEIEGVSEKEASAS